MHFSTNAFIYEHIVRLLQFIYWHNDESYRKKLFDHYCTQNKEKYHKSHNILHLGLSHL